MARENGLDITYAERKNNLNRILDIMYQNIAHKLKMETARVPELVKALSNETGISTTDIRLLLLIDDWTDTFKKIVTKGVDAF